MVGMIPTVCLAKSRHAMQSLSTTVSMVWLCKPDFNLLASIPCKFLSGLSGTPARRSVVLIAVLVAGSLGISVMYTESKTTFLNWVLRSICAVSVGSEK